MEIERKIAVSLPLVSRSTPTNVSNNVFPPVRPMHGRTSGPTRRSTRGQWTSEEDEVLRRAVQHYQGKNWKKIAEFFKERTDVQCLHRWQKVLNPELIKGPWSKEEDETIVQLVNKYGPKKWSTIAQHLPGRIGKQCRERWHNHLNPAINREPWTQEEELVLIRAHQIHGNKWAELTKYLPGRTDNAIKNHWNSSVKKKLDSFLSSGLLAQFQNGDGSVGKGGAKEEDDFESTQIAREISNTACQTAGGEYYMSSLDDVTFTTIPNLPCEFPRSPKYLDTDFSNDDSEKCVNGNCGFDLTALQNISSIYELGNTPNGYDASIFVDNMDLESQFCPHEYWNPFNPSNATFMGEASHCEDLPNEDFTTTLANEVANDVLPDNGDIESTFSEQMDSMDLSKLVPIDTNGLETLDSTGEEGGTLCYEPPRFPPTLNIPLFSCDLTPSCSDGLHDFSPLGIRQLMISSMSSSITPFKLWDSPSSDDTPDAILRSSFETCLCTPSILKKRRRDLLSPLSPFSERRCGRKIRSDVSQGFLCTSKLTKEFSRLDAIVDDTTEISIEKKEDICSVSLKEAKEENRNITEDEPSEMDTVHNNVEGEDEHCASEMPRGILVECHSNRTNFSTPSEARHKEVSKYSEGNSDIHQNCTHVVGPNKDVVSSSLMVDSLLNEVGAENLNIFGGTPFRRSIESPSAWKSPWYFNSLVPCSRFDTDIMLKDMGIFMSPGERSVDALSLMKQINEKNADAYADAKIVLGSDTPDSILRRSCFGNQETEKVNGGQSEGRLRLASNVLTECRTLDFSECATPAKSVDKGKCRNSTSSLSSPSCLLKNYR